jgi:hypothetical protein
MSSSRAIGLIDFISFANLLTNVTSNILLLFWSRRRITSDQNQDKVLFGRLIICWWKFHHRFHYWLGSKSCVPVQFMSIFSSLWYVTIIFLFLIIMRKISYCRTPLISLISYIVAMLNIHTKLSSLCSHLFLKCIILQNVNISTPFYIISHARCSYVQTTSDVIFSFISCWKWKDLISLNRSTDRQTDRWKDETPFICADVAANISLVPFILFHLFSFFVL